MRGLGCSEMADSRCEGLDSILTPRDARPLMNSFLNIKARIVLSARERVEGDLADPHLRSTRTVQ
jgi:hypothetical protein